MLPREEVVRGLDRELEGFAALMRSLDERAWAQPSRCEGWSAGDVAAHVTGVITDITSGRVEGQDTPEVSARQVADRRGRAAAELADELDQGRKLMGELTASFDDSVWASPSPGSYDTTLGQAIQSLWSGFYVHADDIRAAVGRPSERGPGLRASVDYLADLLGQRGWGPATLTLDDLEELPVGGGSGTRRVSGDPLDFVLVATGRADPASLGLDASVNVFA